jgi:hypothetical protein
MTTARAGGSARKFLTRILATSALLGAYVFTTFAVTGVVMTSSVSTAMAQRGRGRGGGGRGRGGGGRGVGIGLGVAAGVIGGAIIADQYRRRQSEDDAVRYCMQRFRSYNPETGTYISAGGIERPCP